MNITQELAATWKSTADTGKIAYATFRRRYWDDPAGFAKDCIDWQGAKALGLFPYQQEVMQAIAKNNRVCARGPHGLGKTCMMAIIVLWFSLTRDDETDWKVVTTASVGRQLTKFLWPEIGKWLRYIKWDVVGREALNVNTEKFKLSLQLRSGEAFAATSHDANLIEGAHASEILYVFDESKVVPDEIWDSVEGAMSAGNAYWFAVSTPGEPLGRFYEIQSRKPGYEDWWTRYVTLNEAVASGQINGSWADQRARQWGRTSSTYKNRVLGEFAEADEDGIIPLAWVEAAQARWQDFFDANLELGPMSQLGADIARQGEDKTVFAPRHGNVINSLLRYEKEDTMMVAGRIASILYQHPSAVAAIDVIGVGAGTFDNVREQFPTRAIAFNASKGTDFVDQSEEWRFADTRSAAWWNMRQLLDPANENAIALPDDDQLTGDLVAPRWRVMAGGKIKVESKQDIRKRIGRSTNDGDAVIQAFWDEDAEAGMQFGFVQ